MIQQNCNLFFRNVFTLSLAIEVAFGRDSNARNRLTGKAAREVNERERYIVYHAFTGKNEKKAKRE